MNEKETKNLNNILISFGNMLFSNEKNRSIAKDMNLLTNIKDLKVDDKAETSDKNTFNEIKSFLTKILE